MSTTLPPDAKTGATPDEAFAEMMGRKVNTLKCTLAADPNEAAEIVELRIDLAAALATARAKRGDEEAEAAAKAAKEAVDKRVEAVTEYYTFHFASIGSAARTALELKHPASAKKQSDFQADNPGQRLAFDGEKIAYDIIVATVTDVVTPSGAHTGRLTLDQVKALFSTGAWTTPDLELVAAHALAVDQTTNGIDIEEAGKD